MRAGVAPATPHGLRWLWLALAVIVLDQVTKYAVRTALHGRATSRRYTDYFSLVLTYNSGAAFSFLAGRTRAGSAGSSRGSRAAAGGASGS